MKKNDQTIKNPNFKDWLKKQSFDLSARQLTQIENEIKREVDFLKSLSVQHRMLYAKKSSLTDWIPEQTEKDIQWVKRMIWRPKGKSDFRRIKPKLIKVNNQFEVDSFNIWGEKETVVYEPTEPYSKHWEIIYKLTTTGAGDNPVGRQMRFLVIDEITKKYLGVICISSAMYRVRAIHAEIGWDAEKVKKTRNSRLNNIANGQAIVPTQPFGSAYLGGKLLSLLCLSKDVADSWEREYGDKLVGVHTTSLYGTENGTQYDNLAPYWKKLPESTSSTMPIKVTNSTYDELRAWMRHKHPEKYYQLYVEKNPETGMLNTRESKTQALKFAYDRLGIPKETYESKEPRGVYSSFLYKNAIDFLNDRISEKQLIPAYENSVQALTEFWRFGTMGDTSRPTEEIRKKAKKPDRIRKKVQMKGMTKGYVDSLKNPIPTEGPKIDWYLDLPNLSWDEIQSRYPDQSQANETPSSVQ